MPSVPRPIRHIRRKVDPPPEPPRVAEPAEKMRRPLMRQTLTVAPPWGADDLFRACPVTVEVIILAELSPDGSPTADRRDLPELQEAGWIEATLGDMECFVRLLGG